MYSEIMATKPYSILREQIMKDPVRVIRVDNMLREMALRIEMTCQRCGYELDSERFCSFCGELRHP